MKVGKNNDETFLACILATTIFLIIVFITELIEPLPKP